MKTTLYTVTPVVGFHSAASSISSVTGFVKSYASPFSVHPSRVKSSREIPWVGGFTVSPLATPTSIRSLPLAKRPPFARKTTFTSVTPGFASHCASSTKSFFTCALKSYRFPLEFHPTNLKPFLAGSIGRFTCAPSTTVCFSGSGFPP